MSRCAPLLVLIALFTLLIHVSAADDDINIIIQKAVEDNRKSVCAGVINDWESRSLIYGILILKAGIVDNVSPVGDNGKVYISFEVPMQSSGNKYYHPWYFKLKSGKDYQLILAYLRYSDKKPFRAWIVPESVLLSNQGDIVRKTGYWIYLILDPANVPSWLNKYEIPRKNLP
jgi:hypothetical protein